MRIQRGSSWRRPATRVAPLRVRSAEAPALAVFHPHLHALATEWVFTKVGRFHPAIQPTAKDLEERFRDRGVERLHRAGRPSGTFEEALRSWPRSGFSVDASQRVASGEGERLERLARYVTRVAMAVGAVRERADGRVEVTTPPDPRTDATVKEMDELDFVHDAVQQIPDAGMHPARHYGALSNRRRRVPRAATPGAARPPRDAGRSRAAPGGPRSPRCRRTSNPAGGGREPRGIPAHLPWP